MNLIGTFDKLTLPSKKADSFSAQAVKGFSSYRIGKNGNGLPVMLIEANGYEDNVPTNVALRNITVAHDIECSIEGKGKKKSKGRFTVIQCNIEERGIHESFLEVIELLIISIGNSPTTADIDRFIHKILEVFRRLVEPPLKTVQGLWAELFLIAVAKKSRQLLKCWHFDDRDKHDFSLESERVEVKSYSSPYRSHSFSLEQLNPPHGCKLLVASISAIRSQSGMSIEDLSTQIQAKVKEPELIEALRFRIMSALGRDYNDSRHIKFDYEVALDSLKYYDYREVPKIHPDEVPKLIFDVRFKVDLSNVKETSPSKLSKPGPLFSALR